MSMTVFSVYIENGKIGLAVLKWEKTHMGELSGKAWLQEGYQMKVIPSWLPTLVS